MELLSGCNITDGVNDSINTDLGSKHRPTCKSIEQKRKPKKEPNPKQIDFNDWVETDIREIYQQNIRLIAKLITTTYRPAYLRAIASGLLLFDDPMAAALSWDVYHCVRLSLYSWIEKGRPGKPGTYIGGAIQNWSSRIHKSAQRPMDLIDRTCKYEGRPNDRTDLDVILAQLSPWNRKLARYLMRGYSQKAIAKKLGIPLDLVVRRIQLLEVRLLRLAADEVQ